MSLALVQNPERENWNAFVSAQQGSSLYQSYEWGQIRKVQGWEPYYVAVADEAGWVGAALVLVKRLPGGVGSLLYSPVGPLMAQSAGTPMENVLPVLVSAVREIARRVGGVFWRIEPRVRADDSEGGDWIEHAGFRRIPQEWSYWNRPKYDMHLDISGGEAAVLSRISSRTRNKIRHSKKRGLAIEVGHDDRDVETLYRLMMNTGAKKRIPVRGLGHFHTLFWTLEKSGMGRLFIARKDGEPVAAGMSSRFGPVGLLLYLSSDYSMKYAGWAVQWEMIRWAIGLGCATYDFAGTGTSYPPKETDKGYGVYQFKRSLGAEIVSWYGYADYVFSPVRYQTFRAVERSLPYGERLFLDWPKGLLYRLRARKKTAEEADPETSKDGGG